MTTAMSMALVGYGQVGFAQGVGRGSTRTSTSSRGTDYDQMKAAMKDELREELKEEIKSELKSELSQEGTAPEPVKGDTFAEEEWKWDEPVKPELNFFEIDGYFRFRYELFKHLDLGTTYVSAPLGGNGSVTGPFSPGYPVPTTLCNLDVRDRGMGRPTDADYRAAASSCANKTGPTDTVGGANMRLRIEPVFNVYEDIKIKMQIDVLDNLVLGSTPDSFPGGGKANPQVPLSAFSKGQLPPSDGVNALMDSIRVKRAWAEIGTPLGQLRVGRMPSHFGLGILANEGRGLESNYGNSADRILFATKIGDFYIIPAFDWVATGPTTAARIQPQGQPYNHEHRDDVDQYILAIVRRDKDQEIKEKLENDELVLNYGTYQVGRFQALDSATYYQNGNPDVGGETKPDLIRRNAKAWIYSFWFKLLWRKLSIEAEYAGIRGTIGNTRLTGSFPGEPDVTNVTLNQHGAALTTEYKLLRDSLTLRLLAVFASGDSAPGWGVRPLSNPGVAPGDWDGSKASLSKPSINNFRFDPDFYVDYIFWRQLVGLVTGAWVFRPGIQYNLTESFGARLDIVYSRAIFPNNTPSASRGPDRSGNLGLEGDLKVFYNSEDGFHAWLVYALFIPFAGLDRQILDENNNLQLRTAGVAQSIQAMLAVTF